MRVIVTISNGYNYIKYLFVPQYAMVHIYSIIHGIVNFQCTQQIHISLYVKYFKYVYFASDAFL